MSLNKLLLKIPPIRYLNNARAVIDQYPSWNQDVNEHQRKQDENIKNLLEEREKLTKEIKNLWANFSKIEGTLLSINTSSSKNESEEKINTELLANNHSLDTFYKNFEDLFRGSEEDIKKRLEDYLPRIKDTGFNYKKYPILDIGCGRGEFLQLLRDNNISASGVDINKDMVKRSIAKGLDVKQANAISYLQYMGANSYSIITGFHIIEHIPFDQLMLLFSAAYKALIKKGFVIFETPNPENIIVGSSTFYLDPSHLHPIPPELLAYSLKSAGFKKTEIIRLHPFEKDIKDSNPNLKELYNLLYGPRDYAVIAYKTN